jgi:cobalt-zinc-cadmium efflux system membrane fusion protein
LQVWVHLYEEDLPAVQALPRPVRWAVTLPAQPGREFAGTLEQIKPVIDPGRHTALAVGRVANPDGLLKVGQFVTATVELPPPAGEVEVPAAAVVEDGRQSVVFVQPDPAAPTFVRHPVKVCRRFADVLYTATDSSPARVHPGDRVVTAGALLLRDALDQLPPAK